jgi:hypothetical protein
MDLDVPSAGDEHGSWRHTTAGISRCEQRRIIQRVARRSRFWAGDYRDFNVGIGFSCSMDDRVSAAKSALTRAAESAAGGEARGVCRIGLRLSIARWVEIAAWRA